MIWYEEEVQKVEKEIDKLSYQPQTLFYGSSSIRLWESLYDDFQKYLPVNLGFGGSTLEACVHFFERIMKPYNPAKLIVYAGDNDLGDGKNAETVHRYFLELCRHINSRFGNIEVAYISIKPSLARWQINDTIIRTNNLIKMSVEGMGNNYKYVDIYANMLNEKGLPAAAYYAEDGLHLSEEGYRVWKKIVLTYLSSFNDI